MKLSGETLSILKNFSAINPGIVLSEGSTVRTISPNDSVLGEASIKEVIPKTVAISNLPRFLAIQELFEDADIEFGENEFVIKTGNKKLRYVYADPTAVKSFAKSPNLPTPDITFDMSGEDLSRLVKASNLLDISFFVVKSQNGKIVASTEDTSNNAIGGYQIELGETDRDFCFIVRMESFLLASGDYTINCSKSAGRDGKFAYIGHFVNKTLPVSYCIALEHTSFLR